MATMRHGRATGLAALLSVVSTQPVVRNDNEPGPAKPDPDGGPTILKQVDVTRGTAEFMNRYRKHLHRYGCVEFEVPRGITLPPWMHVVLDTLRMRERNWRVVTLVGKKGATLHRVVWKHWCKQLRTRGLPLRVVHGA